MNYLSRREHSRAELKRKLLAKDFSPGDIDVTLDKLTSDGLQSDDRFSENYVRYRSQQGFGPLRIAMELRERGITDDIIDQHIDINASMWKKHMASVQKKKFSGTTKSLQQQYRFLLHRGFSPEAIAKIIEY